MGYRGLQGVTTEAYNALQGVTRGYKWLHGAFKRLEKVTEVTRGYKGLRGVTRVYRGLQGLQVVTGAYKG